MTDILLWCGVPLGLMALAYAALFAWMDRTQAR